MVGSIICGVDESESAQGAARVARDLSGKLGLSLLFVRVVDEGSAGEKIDAIAERLEGMTTRRRRRRLRCALAGRGRSPRRPSRRRRRRHEGKHDRRRLTRPSLVAARQRLRRRFEARAMSGRRRTSRRRRPSERQRGASRRRPHRERSSRPRSQQCWGHRPLRTRLAVGRRSDIGRDREGGDMSFDALMRWEWEGGTPASGNGTS